MWDYTPEASWGKLVADMPLVEVIVRVYNDDRSVQAMSTFQLSEPATNELLNEVSPIELTQDLGELFVASIHEQFPNVGFDALPGDLQVHSSEVRGTPIRRRDGIQSNPIPFEEFRHEMDGYRETNQTPVIPPDARVQLSEVDFSG